MENQLNIDGTDFAGFLYDLSIQLKKEGNFIQAIAKMWFSEGEEFEILRQSGIDINNLGRKLSHMREYLCDICKMKDVNTYISFEEASDKQKADSKPVS